jgi:hypothetical protein
MQISAEAIAEHQLRTALRLWQEQDYLSALTLAGAAEEILGKRLQKLGRTPSFDQLKALIVAIARPDGDTDPKLDAEVGNMLNHTRNQLKHYSGDDELCFDLRTDCQEMLGRAIGNFHTLTGKFLAEGAHVWGTAGDA